MKRLLLIFSFAAAPVAAQTQNASPNASEIATTGRGEVHVAPDKAILSVGIETRSGSAHDAVRDNAARVVKTIASLRAAGVDSARITTGGYSLGPDYDKNKQVGFIARNNLRVEVVRITDVGKLIDAELSGGATQVGSIEFMRADSRQQRREREPLAAILVLRDRDERIAELAKKREGIAAYVRALDAVRDGHQKLYDHRNELRAKVLAAELADQIETLQRISRELERAF